MSRKNLNKNKYKEPVEGGGAEENKERNWEFRIALFLLRTAVAVVFVGYLFITSYGGYRWVWTTWAQSMPVGAAVTMADKYLNQKNQPQKLSRWLGARSPKDYDETIKLLTDFTPKMSSETFFIFSDWMSEEGKKDDARFWWMMGKFRMRFDLVRCGGTGIIQKADELMRELTSRKYDRLFKGQPKKMQEAMQRVLDFDAHHPAHNDPYNMCSLAWKSLKEDTRYYQPMPEYAWASLRAGLRHSSETFLAEQKHPDLIKSQERLEKVLYPDTPVQKQAPKPPSDKPAKPDKK